MASADYILGIDVLGGGDSPTASTFSSASSKLKSAAGKFKKKPKVAAALNAASQKMSALAKQAGSAGAAKAAAATTKLPPPPPSAAKNAVMTSNVSVLAPPPPPPRPSLAKMPAATTRMAPSTVPTAAATTRVAPATVPVAAAVTRTTAVSTPRSARTSYVRGDEVGYTGSLQTSGGMNVMTLSPEPAVDALNAAADAVSSIAAAEDQLTAGGRGDLVASGEAIITRYNSAIDDFNNGAWDTVPGEASSAGSDAAAWITQANAALGTIGAGTPGNPITGGPAPWVPNALYAQGAQATNQGSLYLVMTKGTSGTSGPYGNAPSIVDGTVTWSYLGVDPALAAQQAAYGGGGGGGFGGGGGGGDSGSDPFGDEGAADGGGGGDDGGGDFGYDDSAAAAAALDSADYGDDGGGVPRGGGLVSQYADQGIVSSQVQPQNADQLDSDQGVDSTDDGSSDGTESFAEAANADQTDQQAETVLNQDGTTDELVGEAVATPSFRLKSELPGVSDEAWTKFAVAMKSAPVGAVSKSNELGMFSLKPRRLADLDLVIGLEHTRAKNGRMVWVGDFIPPMSAAKFLRSPITQYDAFSKSMKLYHGGMKNGSVPTPQGGRPKDMTLSGALAVLHRCGPSGIKTWNDADNRFPETNALYQKVNGIF